ncbi:group III truncated hemoglobin [Saccharicrinis sp. FJH54]|uniref:group III truncated hemoglobin n=1 Tax=Saccharicrinis sp. FJH54 TaxID=3344665 RepID=UPI0035D4F903
MKKDIETFEDIKKLVDTFYANARKDALIGPIFEKYLSGHWDEHLEKLYRFWQTIILREMAYYGKPIEVHFKMMLADNHFGNWMEIWNATVTSMYEGPLAERAKLRGRTMSEAFLKKIKKSTA